MRRMFWLAVGAGTGVWVTRKVTRMTRQLTPQSLAGRAAGRALDARERVWLFLQDVREEARAREEQLREAIEADLHPPQAPRPRRILNARYIIIDEDKDGH